MLLAVQRNHSIRRMAPSQYYYAQLSLEHTSCGRESNEGIIVLNSKTLFIIYRHQSLSEQITGLKKQCLPIYILAYFGELAHTCNFLSAPYPYSTVQLEQH